MKESNLINLIPTIIYSSFASAFDVGKDTHTIVPAQKHVPDTASSVLAGAGGKRFSTPRFDAIRVVESDDFVVVLDLKRGG